MKIKMLAFDIDGTLIDNKRKISPRNDHVLRALQSQGVLLVPATGRCLSGLPKKLPEIIQLRYVITSNGARTSDLQRDVSLETRLIDESRALRILNICKHHKVWVSIHVDNQCYDSNNVMNSIRKVIYKGDFSQQPVTRNLISMVRQQHLAIEKIQIFGLGLKALVRLQADLNQVDHLAMPITHGSYMEVTDLQANKGDALARLCDYLGVKAQEVMVIGDADNDCSMFDFAGYSIAMGNASDAVKTLATMTTDSNRRDGLAKALEALVLNGEAQ